MRIILLIFLLFNAGYLEASSFSGAELCGSCHKKIYEQWKSSFMAKAFSDPLFKGQFKESKDKKECLRCHAPMADIAPQLNEEGVTCEACHSVGLINVKEGGADVSLMQEGLMYRGKNILPHKKGSNLIEGSQLCAVCHHYAVNGRFVETTYKSWKKSSFAKRGIKCQTCHMPVEEGVKSHRFEGGNSVSFLKGSASIDAFITESDKGTRLSIIVSNDRTGHNLPGGTMGRQVRLKVYGYGKGGKILLGERLYGKVYDKDGNTVDMTLKVDERREEVFYFKKEGFNMIEISLDYYLVPQETQAYYGWKLPVVSIKKVDISL